MKTKRAKQIREGIMCAREGRSCIEASGLTWRAYRKEARRISLDRAYELGETIGRLLLESRRTSQPQEQE